MFPVQWVSYFEISVFPLNSFYPYFALLSSINVVFLRNEWLAFECSGLSYNSKDMSFRPDATSAKIIRVLTVSCQEHCYFLLFCDCRPQLGVFLDFLSSQSLNPLSVIAGHR